MDTKNIEDISQKIYDKYLYIVNNYPLNDSELNEVIQELEDMIIQEELEYQKFISTVSPERATVCLVEISTKASVNKINYVMERIKKKLSHKMYGAEALAKENLKLIEQQVGELTEKDKENIYINLNKCFEWETFIDEAPFEEIQKNNIMFLLEKAKAERDEIKQKILLTNAFCTIYCFPNIEEKLLKCKFNPDKSWICITDSLCLEQEDLMEYKMNLDTKANIVLNTIVATLLQTNMDETRESLAMIEVIKTHLRAILFVYEEEEYEDLKLNFMQVIQDHEVKNDLAAKLLKECLKEADNDKENYIKISNPIIESEIEKIEKEIFNLYDELACLYTNYYDGEDLELEIRDIIEKIRVKKVEEFKVFKEELLKAIEVDEEEEMCYFGTLCYLADDLMEERILYFEDYFQNYIFALTQGCSNLEASQYLEESKYGEIHKNILYFYDDMINNTEGEIREELIYSKFDYIYANPDAEVDAIEYNFEITEENLIFPSDLGMNESEAYEYSQLIRKQISLLFDSILEDLAVMDWSCADCLESEKLKFVIKFRGYLYTLNDQDYKSVVSALRAEAMFVENEMIKEIINLALDYAETDRIRYSKIKFK